MVFGRSQRAFLVNNADAVGQIISTRLGLFLGEWYQNTADGTPWNTQVLGNRTASTRDPVIRARILNSPNVSSIVGYNSQVNTDTRTFQASMQVNTTFGPVAVTTFLPATSVAPPSVTTPSRPFVAAIAETPYAIKVSWNPIPVFVLDDPQFGVMDQPNLLG
jgi:hypothetical protein